jgi:predicted phage baseplate assembly protein
MSALAPNLFTRRFDDLVEIGRSRLPALAPDWTDHSAHDPGITLLELLAWVTEAELYSLARTRRDERIAYAALMGIDPAGTQPARGLIWLDRGDSTSPAATSRTSIVIPEDAPVHPVNGRTPAFVPTRRILWIPGRIGRLESNLADGRTIDLTAINERGGPPFLPFGDSAGPDDTLTIGFDCGSDTGLFPMDRDDAMGAGLVIAVRADGSAGAAADGGAIPPTPSDASLVATLVADGKRYPLDIIEDTTVGLLQTGAIVLDLSKVTSSPEQFAIELRAERGFVRPPRLLRIDLNALPIVQTSHQVREPHQASGEPDFAFDLEAAGLQYRPGAEPVRVVVAGDTGWSRCDDLSRAGPGDRVYVLDAAAGRIRFGNGVNGRVPAKDAEILVSYDVSSGALGNAARNRQWQVAPFQGAFGTNPDPVMGGADASNFAAQRREARLRSKDEHPIVNAADLVEAALALPLLEVARAWVLPPRDDTPRTGMLKLAAMRARSPAESATKAFETGRWLGAIRRALRARLPLGTTVAVIAPRYVDFRVDVKVLAETGRDPDKVATAVRDALVRRLALVDTPGNAAREPGAPVTLRDVGAWIRGVEGVSRVLDVAIVLADGTRPKQVDLPRSGLPRFDAAGSRVDVHRPGTGAAP